MDISNQYNSDNVEIDLGEILAILLGRALSIALSAILAAVIAFCVSRFLVTELYESSTSVYILNKQDSGTVTYSDVQLGTQLTKDYAQLVKSRYVLEKVIATSGIEMTYGALNSRISVTTPSDTRILTITVTDESPAMAQYLANEVRREAAAHITSVMDIQAVNVVDEANYPERPASPNVIRWTLIGFLIGAFICAAIIVVRFMLDDTIKTSDDVEKYLGLSTLGMIPIREDEEKSHKSRRGSKSKHRSSHSSQSAHRGDYGSSEATERNTEEFDASGEMDLESEVSEEELLEDTDVEETEIETNKSEAKQKKK